MNAFHFDGVIPASKSHFNRALICASYTSNVTLNGDSQSDDVQKMKKAINHLHDGLPFDCGSAGTVLRFLALRVSRIPGVHILKGSERLLSRPQIELENIFSQLGIRLEKKKDQFIIHSQGWKLQNPSLKVSREISSQFASAILLNTWNLDRDLTIEWDHVGVSEGYWQMSEQVVKDFGMSLTEGQNKITIATHQKVKINSYPVESDLSSSFAIAAFAALNGQARFQHFPFKSLQPDKVFLQILKRMGALVETTSEWAQVSQSKELLQAVHCNLNDCPDLFPVLAT
ncbi:MAG: 3-phosphoshikimate 1-carboxyvinyltransferase, partial [Bdellovibrio sp.]|nr:3-phosphoshikimate 1-carboxyvinyltransferase [Bdellovibrio sp.]